MVAIRTGGAAVILLGATGGILSSGGVVWAQPAPSGGVEQITVTALKQKTNLQKTPAAITAIPAADLDKSNVTNLAGLNGFVPGLTVTKAAGFENLINIRGVGSATPENSLVTQPGVSLFVDGVYIANTISLDESLFDLARVEVLRGPQGTLYAQSSTGGVISLVTNQPQLHVFSGNADFSVGNYDLFRERAEVNIPVGDTIAVRASIQKYDHGGFGYEVGNHYALDDQHDYSGKIAVLYQPNTDFTATLTAQKYQSNQHGAEQKNVLDPEPDPRLVNQTFASKFPLHTKLVHLNMAYTLPFATLESISAYQRLNNDQSFDSGRLSYALSGSYDLVPKYQTQAENYTQEFDVRSLPGQFEYVAGVFAEKLRSSQFVAEFEGKTADPDITVLPSITTEPPANLSYGNITVVNRVSVGPYAQFTYHISPTLRVIGGARFNYDRYNDFSFNFSNNGGVSLSRTNTIYATKRVTGNGSIQYDVTPTTMLYATATEGYKPGGVNGASNAIVVQHTFKPEEISSIELGAKNEFLDHHLRLNAATFFYDYRQMQYIEVDPVPFAYGIANVPDTHIYGVEADASYLTMDDHLRLNGNVAYDGGSLQGSYSALDQATANSVLFGNPTACPSFGAAFYLPSCQNAIKAAAKQVGGNRPPDEPTIQFAVNATYTADVLMGTRFAGEFASRAEFVYRGSEYARIFNTTFDKVTPYGIVNLDFHFKPHQGSYTLDLALTNIADRNGINSRYTDPYGTGTTSNEYIPPRQVIGTIGYSF